MDHRDRAGVSATNAVEMSSAAVVDQLKRACSRGRDSRADFTGGNQRTRQARSAILQFAGLLSLKIYAQHKCSRVGPGWFGCAGQAGLFLAGEREANVPGISESDF